MFSSTRGDVFRRAAEAIAAVLAAHVVYGCEAGLAECTLDSDCDQGRACEVAECVPVCGADDECSQDEVCVQGLTTDERVCRAETSQMNDGTIRSRFAMVRDETMGAGCETAHPGADLAFVLLEDLDGNAEGWGHLVAAAVRTEENEFSTADHIDGQRPADGADSCPEFDDAHVVSTGCGGWIAVEFVDEQDNIIDARGGRQRLRVGEYGAQCDGDDDLDRYEVLLCPDAEDTGDLPGACTIAVGVGQGERAFGL